MTTLACIVEGDGDVGALPVLVRRMCMEAAHQTIDLVKPIRVRRDSFLGSGPEGDRYRSKYLSLASGKAGVAGRILIVLDAEGDCPADLANAWLPRLEALVAARPIGLVFATTMFEAWFIAGADSLVPNVPVDAWPADPERVRAAKQWVRDNLLGGKAYSPTIDQPRLSARFDWRVARTRAPSLDKLCRELARLLALPSLA